MNKTVFDSHLHQGTRVVLAALVPTKGDENRSLIEMASKAVEGYGAQVVTTVVQRRGVSRARKPGGAQQLQAPLNATTVLGRGKVQELAAIVEQTHAKVVVLCNPVTPAQKVNLERAIGVPVLSYT